MSIVISSLNINDANENYTTIFIDDVEATPNMVANVGQVFKIVASKGSYIDTGTYFYYSRDFQTHKQYFTLSNGNKSGEFVITNLIRNGDLKLELDLNSFEVTQNLLDSIHQNNLTMYHDGLLIDTPITIFEGDISFKAEYGYMFAATGNYVAIADFGGNKNLTISSDSKTASVPLNDAYSKFYFNVIVNDDEQGIDITGYNNLYLIDEDIYNSIQNDRFITTNLEKVDFDFGIYIIKLIELPFNISEDMIGTTDNIRLATKKLDTVAPIIKSNRLIVDLGYIDIPPIYGDGRDFSNSEITLILPYAGEIELNVSDCIDKTISIQYDIDLFSGEATAIIKSTSIDETIATINFNLGFEISINQLQDVNLLGVVSKNRQNNDVLTPFIKVERKVPINEDIYSNLVPDYGVLSSFKGYCEVKNIDLIGDILFREKELLTSILSNGILIE